MMEGTVVRADSVKIHENVIETGRDESHDRDEPSRGGRVGISVEFRCAVLICTISSAIACVNGPSGGPSGSGHGHATIGIGDVKIESDNT